MCSETATEFSPGSALVVQSAGSGKLNVTGVASIKGGTGKFSGIRGVVRTVIVADPKAGFNEGQNDLRIFGWISSLGRRGAQVAPARNGWRAEYGSRLV